MSPGFRDSLMDRDSERIIRLALRRVTLRPGGGGTLLSEPVVVWYGSHRGDYRAFDPERSLLASAKGFPAPEGYEHRYQVSDADDRRVFEILVSNNSSARPHVILAPGGQAIVSFTLTGKRGQQQHPIVAGEAVIGSLHERRTGLRDFPTTVSDSSGHEVAGCRVTARDESTRIARSGLEGPLRVGSARRDGRGGSSASGRPRDVGPRRERWRALD